jgi:TM2 domain-containing membrane protein YozV
MSDQTTYTLRWRGREFGPYSMEQINQKLDDHEIGMGHEILDQDKWLTLDEFFAALKAAEVAARPAAPAKPPPIPSLGGPAPSAPPTIIPASTGSVFGVSGERPAGPPPPIGVAPTATAFRRAESPATPTQSPRHRLAYAVLGILFGFLGVHNYYARHWLTGLLQLMLSVATTLLGFGIIASWLWALVEAVLVRRDGNGNEMI